MQFKDYYETLGVSKKASSKEIKQAYRRLARKYHPDVNPGSAKAESRFKDITEAYEVLGNPQTRNKYDDLGANWKMHEHPGAPGNPNQGPFGSGTPFGSGGGWTVNFGDGPGASNVGSGRADPFSDFFHSFFGGSHSTTRPQRPVRTTTQEVAHTIDLSLEEAFRGVERRLSIAGKNDTRVVVVRIPPGVSDRSRIRIPYDAGVDSAASGKLVIRIHITPHPIFRRKGRDLHTAVIVPLTTAILGGSVPVKNIAGLPLNLKIPAGTQPGQVFRLKGHGMPGVRKPADRGALYAAVELLLPRELSNQQRAHYEALADLEGSEKQNKDA
ncbi:MAG: molecular chaperone DnaJ [Acidobacteria bacterium]|nr:molecular chaperone DnaJ [Acidobacteriota bacterium]|tara:strand:- start:316 stop:1296 length:981 start_codon:yes stop_codon:yes gene_type:complete